MLRLTLRSGLSGLRDRGPCAARSEVASPIVASATRGGGVSHQEQRGPCDGCGRSLDPAVPTYRLRSGSGTCLRCRTCALTYGPLLRRSLRIAGVIGSVLLVINQGDALFMGQIHSALAWKIPATFAVPFIVATWSALSNSRVR